MKRINLENVPLKPRKGSLCDLICCYWMSRWVFSCCRGVQSENNLPGVIWVSEWRVRGLHLLFSAHPNVAPRLKAKQKNTVKGICAQVHRTNLLREAGNITLQSYRFLCPSNETKPYITSDMLIH